ncbi:BSD domain-containing protein 1 isoform X1 [Aplysia californica]|uniref:BSD domain-containing protein 1 isoform X1 n=1 Tax=Aplysia californica TaxID=6500 RepID=A0ABM1VVK2_APLCA|nr:BSD domain-containing protein 1 isoform X1 [Aplysia californica]
MADGGKEQSPADNSWESWLGGWMQTAKEKSTSALEFVKNDLAEFTCTMQKETEKVVEKTSSQLKDSLNRENTAQATSKVKAGLTSFLDNISKVLVIPPDEDDEYVPMKVAADGSGLYDRGKARLHALQLDAGTYIDPPRCPPEQFAMWQESFDLDVHKGQISELLVSKVEVRALYTKLVPGEVSHLEFWQRYFFRVHQLEVDEARKRALMLRADQARGDSLGWDDDDWSGGEEDDGNHSDWEKLARPPQSQAASPADAAIAAATLKATPTVVASVGPVPEEVVQPVETRDTSQVSLESPGDLAGSDCVEGREEPASDRLAGDNGTARPSTAESVRSEQQGVQEKELPAPESCPSAEDKEDSCSTSKNDSDALGVSESVATSQMATSDLWSLHIPQDRDTASAAPSPQRPSPLKDTDSGSSSSTTSSASTQRGERSPDVSVVQQEVVSVCAAAAGGDVSSAEVRVTAPVSADGAACGAADVLTSSVGPQGERSSAEPEVGSEVTPSASVVAAAVRHVGQTEEEKSPPATSAPSVQQPGPSSAENSTAPPKPADSPTVPPPKPTETPTAPPPKPTDTPTAPPPKPADTPTAPPPKPADTPTTKVAEDEKRHQLTDVDTGVPQSGEESGQKMESQVEPAAAGVSGKEGGSGAVSSIAAPLSDQDVAEQMAMKVKGDMVVVGDRGSPSSESSGTKACGHNLGLEDEWDQDFDLELTEEDLKAAEDIAKRLGDNINDDDDDWENWE